MIRTAGLVLAAGAGRRFGGAKAVVELDGVRLVERAVAILAEARLDPIVVVSGAVPLDVAGATVVTNPGWAEGLGASLRVGLAALPDTVDAVVVLLVDQPGITTEAVRRVVAALEGPRSVAVATYDGRDGHPVALGRAHWPAVAESAVGDRGARGFLRAYAGDIARVECADVATDRDIDDPQDLAWFSGPDRPWSPEPDDHR